MRLFALLARATDTLMTGVATRRKPKGHLIDFLIDGEPKPATLLLPATRQAITNVREVATALFGDTRQQYQQALNITYTAEPGQRAEQEQRRNLLVGAAGLGLATAGVLVTPLFYWPSIVCTLYITRMFVKEAYHLVFHERRFNYRVIVALMTPAVLAGGFIWPAAFGTVLGLINKYLVVKTEHRAKRHVAHLFGGQVRTVWLWVDGVEVETPFDKVQRGDMVVVQAGQMIPVDGMIAHGVATIDQQALTGEARPVEKGIGERVLASTVVLTGRLAIVVEQAGDATVAAQITHMLNQTTDFKEALRSRTEVWLNRMVLPLLGLSVLALPVAGVSGALAVFWYYPGFRMILFGPLSMLSYLQVAAQQGMLVKDGRALESLQDVDTVVFDKTGTLTLEQPTVSRIFCCNGVNEADILRYAAAAEAKQSHPIARAILQAAHDHQLDLPLLVDAEYKVGYGLKAQAAGRTTVVGSLRLMTLEGFALPPELIDQQAASHALGHSLVLVAIDGEVVGAIELQPTIRPEAHAVIQELHQRGLATVIISGDHDAPTRRLAAELGIDRYFAEVLPEDKANLVMQLQEEGHKVCFVGDGINDAIALKTANVAVSLRGATTIATDMAEIVLMDGALGQLPTLFALTDDFAANMRTNLLAATIPGVLGIAGTLLFGWGITTSVILSQVNIPVGIYNALQPLLAERKKSPRLLR